MNDAMTFLRDFVAIPSLSGDEGAAARFLVEKMTALGFDARVDDVGNAVGVLGDGPREIVLLGHLDTVPGGPAVELRDGRLYGRGAVDAKGPLAAFVLAAGRGAVPGWRIVVAGAVEEEVASSKGARHLVGVLRPDACVIGEPSGWDGVTLGYKGRLVANVGMDRPTSHSAGPEASAAERVVAAWNAVAAHAEHFNRGRERLFDRLQCRLDRIESGVDGDREHVRASLGFRLPPSLGTQELRAELERLLAEGDVDMHVAAAEEAFVGDRRSELVRAFSRALRQGGTRPHLKVKTGTSDMNVVGPVWRCPILAYGPGDSRLDHTPDEHIVIEDFLRSVDVLRRALVGLRC